MHRQLFRILYIYIAARDQKATRSGSVLERLCSRPFSADLDENGVYVIGGLVDHNQHKVDLPVLCPSLSLSLSVLPIICLLYSPIVFQVRLINVSYVCPTAIFLRVIIPFLNLLYISFGRRGCVISWHVSVAFAMQGCRSTR